MPRARDMKDFNLAANTHVDRERPICLDVGDQRQLLFDDFFVAVGARPEQLPHGIGWAHGPVVKHPEPLFAGQPPWETSTAWACVLRDGGRFRMWYNSGHDGVRGLRVSYAESQDGVDFERRRLGLVELAGARDNNLVFAGDLAGVSPELGNVFVDPVANAAERYKMVYTDWEGPQVFDQPFTHDVGMLRGAASPDGLHWQRYWANFTSRYCDSQNAGAWDPDLGRYVVYHRTSGGYGRLDVGPLRADAEVRGRALGRLESRDFCDWHATGIALQADFEDGLGADVYTNAYSRYPGADNAHFLFPSLYRHYEGDFQVQVCTSRDNRTWSRPTRQTYIPLGPAGAFDSFIISVCPGFVALDDDHYALYYRAGNGPHRGGAVTLSQAEQKQVASRIGRVVLQRDRIVGVEAGRPEGRFCTRLLRVRPGRLRLNLEPTGPDAQLRAQLLSAADDEALAGYTFADCHPLTADDLDAQVSWVGRAQVDAATAARPLRLHLQLRQMRIYAFQFGG